MKYRDKIRTMEFFLQLTVNTLITASLYTILGFSFSLIYSVNKYFDMTVAAYIVLGAYSVYFLQKIGTPTLFAVVIALVITALFAYLLESFYYKKLRSRHATSFIFMIASLGILTILQAILAILFTSNVQTLKSSGEVHHLVNTYFTNVHLASFASETEDEAEKLSRLTTANDHSTDHKSLDSFFAEVFGE